jgi:hypothetical protein
MFERFTEPARRAVVDAQEEAGDLRHGYIGTEHILLGLLRDPSGVAKRALDRLGIERGAVRSDVVRLVGEGPPIGFGEHDAEVLRSIGIDLDEVRRRLEEAFGAGLSSDGNECDTAGGGGDGARPTPVTSPSRVTSRSPLEPRRFSSCHCGRLGSLGTGTSGPSTSCSGWCESERAWRRGSSLSEEHRISASETW